MSYSSLYGIKNDFTGEVIAEYKNSWLFSPVVWNVLSDKTLPRTLWGDIQSMIGMHGNDVFKKINNKMNKSDNTSDRVCWELSNQQIFFTKDKECIAESISRFIEQNKSYYKFDDGESALEKEHIIERFNAIADDILALDEKIYPFFVFKNTSVDDSVERWFSCFDEESEEYKECPLYFHKDDKNYYFEFVVMNNRTITNFVLCKDFDYEKFKELLTEGAKNERD